MRNRGGAPTIRADATPVLGVGVRVRVPAILVVMVIVAVVHQLGFAADVELRRADPGAYDSLGPHVFGGDSQAAEGAAHVGERHAGVDQRAEDHVAGGTREAVEVEDSHTNPAGQDAARASIL
jgi:hypothetical protein